MAHFLAIAVMDEFSDAELESIMAPYYEGLVVPAYIQETKKEVLAKRNLDITYFKKTIKKIGAADHYLNEQLLIAEKSTDEEWGYRFVKDDEIDSCGDILSTYNKEGLWDYYTIGGRWHGYLVSFLQHDIKLRNLVTQNYNVDICLKSELCEDIMLRDKSSFNPCRIIIEGVLHKREQIFLHASPEEIMDIENKWRNIFIKLFKSVKPYQTIVVVDYHS